MEIVPFIKPAEILKADVKGDRIRVLIEASSERRDNDGDMFLKSSWEMKEDKDFFMTKGYYDYNHLTRILRVDRGTPEIIAKSELARAQAIIGYPETLEWQQSNNRLISEGFLHPENEFVKAIVQGLRAGNNRWGASVCGGAFRPNPMTTKQYGEKTWDRARLTHIAICPLVEAKNEDTAVILKSIAAEMLGGAMSPAVARDSDYIEGDRISRLERKVDILMASMGPTATDYSHVYTELLKAMAAGEIRKEQSAIEAFLNDWGISENDCEKASHIILQRLR